MTNNFEINTVYSFQSGLKVRICSMCLEIISHLSQLTKKCISFCLLCLLTKETAIAYIEERYTGYQIKPVKVDEMCILHFFRDALDSIGIEVTVEEIK